mmetsp:Transcript_160581/g.515456  ORF Transcript_160581/g.515456 Transcript_160581/m.515456 type:complete len:334 (+) Transcript_160581:595-1596(+)
MGGGAGGRGRAAAGRERRRRGSHRVLQQLGRGELADRILNVAAPPALELRPQPCLPRLLGCVFGSRSPPRVRALLGGLFVARRGRRDLRERDTMVALVASIAAYVAAAPLERAGARGASPAAAARRRLGCLRWHAPERAWRRLGRLGTGARLVGGLGRRAGGDRGPILWTRRQALLPHIRAAAAALGVCDAGASERARESTCGRLRGATRRPQVFCLRAARRRAQRAAGGVARPVARVRALPLGLRLCPLALHGAPRRGRGLRRLPAVCGRGDLLGEVVGCTSWGHRGRPGRGHLLRGALPLIHVVLLGSSKVLGAVRRPTTPQRSSAPIKIL